LRDQSGRRLNRSIISSSSSSSKPDEKGENDDEDEDGKNKKPSSRQNRGMKAFSESRTAHAERAGLILLLTEKLAR
jgi:hypothetical protein